jgi:hypothetical protein
VSVAALPITTEAMVAEVPKNAGGGMPPGGGMGGGLGGMDFQVNRSALKRKDRVRLGRLVKNRRHDLILPAMPKIPAYAADEVTEANGTSNA